MDGADGVDSEVFDQIFFQCLWILDPVEELVSNNYTRDFYPPTENLQSIKADQGSLSLKRGTGDDIIKGAVCFLRNNLGCFLENL